MANFTTTGSDTFPAGHVIQTRTKEVQLTDNGSNYCATSATGGIVMSTGGNALDIGSWSSAAGNLVKVDWSAGTTNGTGNGNGVFGVKIGNTIYTTNFIIAQGQMTMTSNFAMVFGSGLSNVTVAAWMAAPNSVARTVYHHDYTALYTGVWTMTVQEIKQ